MGRVDLDEIALSLISEIVYKPPIIVTNKIDVKGTEEKLNTLKECFGNIFKIIGVSVKREENFEAIQVNFKEFNIVRIYTKRS